MTVQHAKNAIVQAFRESFGQEAHEPLNDASRALVAAVAAEYGKAFLGRINVPREHEGKPVVWEHDGGMVYNFGADFVLPTHDPEVERLILERAAAPYTGTREDAGRVDAILQAIDKAGGHHLFWS